MACFIILEHIPGDVREVLVIIIDLVEVCSAVECL